MVDAKEKATEKETAKEVKGEAKGETKGKDKAKKAAASEDSTPAELMAQQKKQKQAWTLQRCQKFARRFPSEQDWAAGAPASYKKCRSTLLVRNPFGHYM